MDDNEFEKKFNMPPQSTSAELSAEQEAVATKWEETMDEVKAENAESGTEEGEEKYINGARSATKLIKLINKFALKEGVESTVQRIKTIEISGSSDPMSDLYRHFGAETPEEYDEAKRDAETMNLNENEFNDNPNAPVSDDKSAEGILAAIRDFKNIINEVEDASPIFNELRMRASSAGKGYFEYAVSEFGVQDLTALFKVLSEQKEKIEEQINEGAEEKNEANVPKDNQEGNGDLRVGGLEEIEKRETLNPDILNNNAA